MKESLKLKSFKEYEKKIADYEMQVRIMCNKQRPHNVLIVSGDPGIGKSYRAEQILKNQTNMKYHTVTGSLSAVELCRLMWYHNDEIIVIDDVNSILQDGKDAASLLKACTESKPVRVIQWQKKNHDCIPVQKYNCKDNSFIQERMNAYVRDKDNRRLTVSHEAGGTFPDMFYFTGAVIILTNKSLKSFDKVTEGAVSNRGSHMQISFSVEGAIDFIRNFGPSMTEFNGMKMEEKTIKDVIAFMTSDEAVKYYIDHCKIPTLRNLGKIEGFYQCGEPLNFSLLDSNTESQYSA